MSLARLAAALCVAALALPACQKSDLGEQQPPAKTPDATLALALEGRWIIVALDEDGDAVVGEDGVYDYATLDFDYEGDAGGELEIALASAQSRIHLDGTYAADAARGVIAFDGESRFAYGETNALIEPVDAEFRISREGENDLALTGVVGGSQWVIQARRD